ncbi:D-alanyl-D-alanine carboxypeptidase family protein [Neobacillus sp. D3-1R]|uniref:D-alanyl-D-alanine carboxypeptidase family protein n=1 Tax=Neobacillus sp. D3-1R TaxID=3445778 RepID=UPI003FA144DF
MKYIKFILTITLAFFLSTEHFMAASTDNKLTINSEAAILMDSQSGAVLYEKNANERLYPASLTKIATAIYAIEKGKLYEIVTVGANAVNVEGTKVFLNEGEQVPLKHLIQGMLINSGNDAAIAIAEYLDGDIEHFSNHINQFLRDEIGVTNTNFTNPNGLFDENHYTTAYDLGIITNYALKNPTFKEIFGTKELKWHGESWDTTLRTHNRLLKGEIPFETTITGGKTGYVDQSKQTLATTATNGKLSLTAIVLKNESKTEIYSETVELLRYGFKHYQTLQLDSSTIYQENKKQYRLNHPIYITESVTGSEPFIDKNGQLVILDEWGKTIQTVPLKEIKKESKPTKVASTKHDSGFLLYAGGGGSLLLLLIGILFLRKKHFHQSDKIKSYD